MSEPQSPIRIFVSHSSADNDFSVRLVDDLRHTLGSQDSVWYDSPEELSGGTSWWSTILREIGTRNIFLVILSPDAMNSKWVGAEIDIAWQQMLSQNEANKRIIPVLYRSCEVRDDLQTLSMISFEAPRPYQEAFAQLLLALQTPAPAQSFTSSQRAQAAVSSTTEPPLLWTVPFRRNPFFTGRETLLAQLHQKLTGHRPLALTQPQAINGLGGIGKTQIAVEYAYRYREHYRYVLWLRATTPYDLLSDFGNIAQLLDLPIKNEPDQHRVAAMVRRWLELHREWLLIFDNADDLALVTDFLPQSNQGHILLTTRAQATGRFAQALPVEKMDLEEGVLFLLRRAKRLELDPIQDQTMQQSRIEAEAIVHEVDGLPLAIDQVGAYIEETQCSLASYLKLYRTHRKDLLRRRGSMPTDHPEPVALTWALSFQGVEQINPAAADLLRVCAFLDPDAIPEELLMKGASQLGPVLEPVVADVHRFNEAIEVLLKYSLVKRNADEQVLSVHRLVQAVLRDEMDEATQLQWAERTVRAVAQALPVVDVTKTASWQLYLPHASVCTALIDQYSLFFVEGVQLLHRTASFLTQRGLYHEAEPLQKRALIIGEKVLGEKHVDTATILNDLATIYWELGNYTEAEQLYQRALAICKEVRGEAHPDTAIILNNLAILYDHQGRFAEARLLYQQALAICKEVSEEKCSDTATVLNNLALLYHYHQREDREAEQMYQQALVISEEVSGADHPDTATTLNNLAMLYGHQRKFVEAEALHRRALAIRKELLGERHQDVAQTLHTLATLYYYQGKFAEAEPLYQQALAIYKEALGERHPATAINLSNLAALYHYQEKYEKAEPLYRLALAIQEETIGKRHPDTATSLNNLALLCIQQGRYEEAEVLCQRVLAVYIEVPEPLLHPQTATSLNNLGLLYHVQKKYEEAESLYKRALIVCEKLLGTGHPTTTTIQKNYVSLLYQTNRSEEAARLEVRSYLATHRQNEPTPRFHSQ